MLIARDLMTDAPATVTPATTLRRAVEILQTLDIRHLPVVNEDGELIGMLSDRDLRALSIPYFMGSDCVGSKALDGRVSSIMSGDTLSVDAETDIAAVVDLMLENTIGAVPVTGEDGALVGIVSYIDILRNVPLQLAAE